MPPTANSRKRSQVASCPDKCAPQTLARSDILVSASVMAMMVGMALASCQPRRTSTRHSLQVATKMTAGAGAEEEEEVELGVWTVK